MNKNKKNILITGAGGFVGKRLVKIFLNEGHKVSAILNKGSRIPTSFKDKSNLKIYKIDLEHFDEKTLPRDIDILYTLAQSNNFREFPNMSEEVFKVNVLSNLKLLNWATSIKIRKIIHASSGGIYGGKFGKILKETDLLAINSPLGFYLGSKLCSEVVFQNYMTFFDTAVILRPFFIYGPGQRNDMFIQRLIESVKKGVPIYLQGKEGLKINPIYIDDAVIAFKKASNLTSQHIFNVAGKEIISLKTLGDLIGELLDKKPVYEYTKGKKVDYVGNIELASQNLDTPITSLRLGIEKTIKSIS